MKLLAVLVNYRTSDMTIDAVASLLRDLADIDDARVVVVDNDSRDGSFTAIGDAVTRNGWSDRVEVLASDKNGGFGYGNNLAIRRALASNDPPKYFYLLNSDAFPDKGAVAALLDCLERHSDVGVAGSYIHGLEGHSHGTVFRFPTVLGEFENGVRLGLLTRLLSRWVIAPPLPEQSTTVDWCAGASMMIRREVFESVGLFDEQFFLYYEETDLCLRAQKAGWATYFVRESSVGHIGSVSTGMKDLSRPVPAYWFESRRYYFRKHYGEAYAMTADVLWAIGYASWRLRRRLQGKPERDPPHLLRDFVRHNVRLRLEELRKT